MGSRARGVAIVVGAIVAASVVVVAVWPSPAGPTSAAPSATPAAASPSGSTAAPSEPGPSSTMPPAWLAWIAGSLPPGFARAAADEPALGATVVVAGDTRWMTESRDDGGAVVDRPDPPFAIPIDAFAVAPGRYAPFLPDRYRRDVTATLREGGAVLGATSAALRRLGPGGSLRFGGTAVDVGLVVPDPVVGYAEMLVSSATGRRLGVIRDRYLVAMPEGRMTPAAFRRTLRPLLPGTDVEVIEPGGSEFMRIASGVNPPVVTKTIFGEFSAVRQADPAFLTIAPAWVRANIRTQRVPLLGRVTCHRLLLGPLVAAMREIRRAGLAPTIRIYSGCWAARTVARSSTAPPSQHAYGAAIDINAPFSPFGSPPNFDPRAVAILESHGFDWGGDFLIPDGHHFEWGLTTAPPA